MFVHLLINGYLFPVFFAVKAIMYEHSCVCLLARVSQGLLHELIELEYRICMLVSKLLPDSSQSDYSNLSCYPGCTRILTNFSHPLILEMMRCHNFAHLVGIKCYLIVILISIAPITNEVEHFFHVYFPLVYPLKCYALSCILAIILLICL